MKKIIEIHLGNYYDREVDANLDIYIEGSFVSAREPVDIAAGIVYLLGLHNRVELGPTEYHDAENIAELFREYIETHPNSETKQRLNSLYGINIDLESGYPDTDSVRETVEDLEIYAYAKCGEFDALAEHPVVKDLCDCVNSALSELCGKVGKITGKDMSYYEELTEIEPALFAYMHPQTAVNIIREQYLTYAEILIAIAKEALSESEDWI